MLVRMFQFRVPKRKERAMRAFMRREASRMLRRIPSCRAAYFLKGEKRGEYIWITVWTSDAARRRAMARKDWKDIVRREEKAGFLGRHAAKHFTVVLKK
jgi:hypothetical protein